MVVEYRISTPEGVALSYELAGIGSRSLAALIDFLVMVAAIIAILLGTLGLALIGGVFSNVALIFLLTCINVLFWGYYIFFETIWEGQSPGKRQLGLRVVKVSGTPITFLDSVVRNIVRIVDFLPSFYGLGILVMFVSPLPRRLGDFAAGTIVVREEVAVSLKDLTRTTGSSTRIFPDESKWSMLSIGSEDERAVRSFMESAERIRPVEMRERRAREVAHTVAAVIGADEYDPPEQFLARVLVLGRGTATRGMRPRLTARQMAWDVRQLTTEDERLVSEFLNRAPDLNSQARQRLGTELADRIATAVGAGPPIDAESFLREVLLARRGELT